MSVPDVLPPSPPTTNHRHRSSIPITFKPLTSTPDDSPASFPPSSGTDVRKKVGFSPWPNVVDPLSSTPLSDMINLKALPPSRDCQSSAKSILKPYTEPVVSISSFDGPNDSCVASPEALEAIALQLANNNKGSSLDAYQTLSQIIKAYDEIPEDTNSRTWIVNILKCIKRDLSVNEQTQSSPIDTNLMTQALKVSVIMVWSEHLSPLLTDDFRFFLVDRSIVALTEHTAPKIIIIHYMHLLAMQNFRQGIISSSNRVVRLLEALQEITNHVQGKGAVSERLLIYHKLIEQAKFIMKSRANLWVREVFLGLSSSVKDIRDKAISVSTRACAAFPSSPTISTAAREALTSTIADKAGNSKTLSTVLTQRLEKMVAAKDEAAQVPQIWALGMLLCNSIDTRLESWNLLRDWLKVIQRCFNCSDTTVRSQAFPAWNRFIHISKPHEASDNIVAMLAKPIIAQIERTSSNVTGKGLRPAAISSYCMLLYHSFRPAASHKQYTRMWNEYIVKIMGSQFLSKTTANADLCSRVLISLMWKEPSVSRIWNENRAHENTLLEPEELPTIDCKWTRLKTEAILQIFALLFKHSVWGPSIQHSDQAFVAIAWRHFLRAIRESAIKEIKPSADTRKALSHIASFLEGIAQAESGTTTSEIWDGRSRLACNIAIAELGSTCFFEVIENDKSLNPSLLIGELVRTHVRSMNSLPRDGQKPGSSLAITDLPPSFHRCMVILNENLLAAYNKNNFELGHLSSYILSACKALKATPTSMTLKVLKLLQSALSTMLEDKRCLVTSTCDQSALSVLWENLSEVTVNKIESISPSDYRQIDTLLSAYLLSSNIRMTNALLKAWSRANWRDGKGSYGPQLLDAIGMIQRKAEVNLPGISVLLAEKQNETQLEIPEESLITYNQSTDQANSPGLCEANEEHTKSCNRAPINNRGATDVVKSTKISAAEIKDAHRSHHDDSQVQFMPVASSPKGLDEVESQFLTERQKEVRDRQHAEHAVTFPDLRSSPRHHSGTGLRPSLVQCEMARKVAAMNELPSTPTLNRQHDNLDEDELPSPTPRARHKILDQIDVEIPSSPPSATRKARFGINGEEVPSSPPKGPNEAEFGMVNLEDTELSEEVKAITNSDPQNSGTDGKAPDQSTNESNLPSTVLETVQAVDAVQPPENRHIRDPSPAIDQDQNDGSDDVEDLSASQLSQSLDWHVAEEARNSVVPTRTKASKMTTQKRRKRATSGYADQDRRKRRKRLTSSGEASMSSAASDGSNITSEDVSMEDTIVVSTTPPTTPGRHLLPFDIAIHEAHHSSPATQKASLREAKADEQDCMPLHTRMASTGNIERSSEQEYSAANEGENVLIQNDEDSIYESIVLHARKDDKMTGNQPENEYHEPYQSRFLEAKSKGESSGDAHASQTDDMHIMTALQMALDGLSSINAEQRGKIDLKAIDDLCFKIRYQAQEVIKGRAQL